MHNKHVVDRFVDQGVVFVNSIEEVPSGGTVVYSAHGVSPEIRHKSADRELVQVDATCPLVTKVHSEAIRFAKKKYTIVLIGHEDHDEVIGTLGEAPDCIRIVESPEDVQRLEIPADHKIAYLTQTTLSIDDANVIIDALRASTRTSTRRKKRTSATPPPTASRPSWNSRRFPISSSSSARKIPPTPCASSKSPRTAASKATSSMTSREINHDWLNGVNTLLLTAGASAPEDLVQAIIEVLKERYGATVEDAHVTEENMHFELPYSLRRLEQKHHIQLTVSAAK